MDEYESKTWSPLSDHGTVAAILALIGLALLWTIFDKVEGLLTGPFPVGRELYLTYFAYTASTILLVHAICFAINYGLRAAGSPRLKRLPKYIEYVYAAVLSISLLQIFVSGPRFGEYVSHMAGDEPRLLSRIAAVSKKHVEEDCKRFDRYFTLEYCSKMKQIADADDLKSYVLMKVATDRPFLDHIIGYSIGGNDAPDPVTSDIRMLVYHLYARNEYGKLNENPGSNVVFWWVAMLLLPIGLGLRLAKTSLELFGGE